MMQSTEHQPVCIWIWQYEDLWLQVKGYELVHLLAPLPYAAEAAWLMLLLYISKAGDELRKTCDLFVCGKTSSNESDGFPTDRKTPGKHQVVSFAALVLAAKRPVGGGRARGWGHATNWLPLSHVSPWDIFGSLPTTREFFFIAKCGASVLLVLFCPTGLGFNLSESIECIFLVYRNPKCSQVHWRLWLDQARPS